MDFDYDLVVLGAGSGGVRAARIAAGLGAKVAIVEAREWGGTCVHRGCVPKKLWRYAADAPDQLADLRSMGWDIGEAHHDWAAMRAAVSAELQRLGGVYGRLLDGSGVERVVGRGEVVDAHSVRVGERVLRGRYLLIATGGRPVVPDVPGAELGFTSDGFFQLAERPRRVVVVGSGYIGVELGSVLHGVGSEVTVVHRADVVLRGFDDESRAQVDAGMRARGVRVEAHQTIRAVERDGDELIAWMGDTPLRCDAVLWATGRVPNTDGIGLEAVGVNLGVRGEVAVDDRWRSSVPSIFAVGDVIDAMTLTPVALAQGMQLAKNLFGGEDRGVDLRFVPTAVFGSPNLSSVGLCERQARSTYGDIRVFTSSFRPMKQTLGGRPDKMFMKLIVDAATDRVVGLHVVGPDAGEIVQGFAVALQVGATKAQLDATIGIHPTAAEELVTLRTPRA